MYKLKKITAAILVGLLLISGLSLANVSAQTPPTTGAEISLEARIEESMTNAISWLRTTQAQDGSWSGDLGITAFLTLALLNAGFDEEEPMISKALEYVEGYVQLDGSISAAPTYGNYYTSVSILALSATANPDYESAVKAAAQFLMESQLKTANEDIEEVWLGGFGYGGGKHLGRPDISNTQFTLMALHSAEANFESITVPEALWERTIEFLTSCQNLVETNPLASDTASPSYNDGGFVYYPGFSKAGEGISYGSSTSAGVWCLFLAGLDIEDQRVAAGLEWLNDNYDWELNPNLETKGLYNYYWGAARANTFSKKSVVIDQNGDYHNWYAELADHLIALQSPEGYWENQDSDWFWEDIPELATAYTLLALETQLLAAVDQSAAAEMALEVELECEAGELHVYDSRGGHIGQDYNTGELENTITQGHGKYTSRPEYQKIELAEVKAGGYYINIVGNENENYNLKISGVKGSQLESAFSYTGELKVAENKGTSVVVTSVERPLTLYTAAPKSIPMMDLDTERVEVERGKTITVQLTLEELSGAEALNDVSLSCSLISSGAANEITFDNNNFDIEAGSSKVVTCTIEVPSDFETTDDEYILIESSNAPAVQVQLDFKTTADDDEMFGELDTNTMILVTVVGVVVLLVIIFGIVGQDKRKRK